MIDERSIFDSILIGWAIVAAISFLALFKITAPYGRHESKSWGPSVSSLKGWILMEAPSCLMMFIYFIIGNRQSNILAIIFLVLWQIHYVNRSFVYPFRLSNPQKAMPFAIMFMGAFFNFINTYMQGRWLFYFAPEYSLEWLYDPRFISGTLLFVAGMYINHQSDSILRGLRKDKSDTGYKIPHGGMYRFISSPNYFGEIIEWTGWAILTWSLPGLLFALWTFANLAPRAMSHHKWYKGKFKDYPKDRKALIPFVV